MLAGRDVVLVEGRENVLSFLIDLDGVDCVGVSLVTVVRVLLWRSVLPLVTLVCIRCCVC